MRLRQHHLLQLRVAQREPRLQQRHERADGEMFDSKLRPSTCGCAITTFCSYASLSASRDCATTTCSCASLENRKNRDLRSKTYKDKPVYLRKINLSSQDKCFISKFSSF